ncbi:hypothetical protein BBW65_03645 [Helicobacter enhydrae]|uniref:Restriction endonuclease n=1 Tax=Helicobacter enhydrae TaxID=222136 RepID=A0A1B1U5B2_9HELI|nr:McrC family protein [Helicobacter enhydrae]ANV97946.1 hypothetical protein BBW65_03645 [Helicobacter enhydrae]
MKPLIYPIIEYQSFGVDDIAKKLQSDKDRARRFFESLGDFAKGKGNGKFLRFDGVSRLKAQNHVGVIQTRYGTLEILPKCFDQDTQEGLPKYTKEALQKSYKVENFVTQNFETSQDNNQSAKALLITFLKTLKDLPFKLSQTASLDTSKIPLLDIFIQNFCREFAILYQKGIRHDYVSIQENFTYLKGKLLFKEQMSQNLIHKERFFIETDAYLADIAQNRIIKSTLLFLKTRATSARTRFEVQKSLELFENIPPSQNIDKDFEQCKGLRHFSYYEKILAWCKVFLYKKSFTSSSGKEQNFALLFSMEKLFESYVATMLTKNNPNLFIKLQTQSQFLIKNNNEPLFALKPDMLVKDKGEIKILDTKWKILDGSSDERKCGVSQADLYQMWAYACSYQAKEVWIIYPLCEKTKAIQKQEREWCFEASRYLSFCTQENKDTQSVQVKILFAPLGT